MLKNLLIFIVLSLAFGGFFMTLKNDAGMKHALEIESIPSVKMFGASETVEKSISNFGVGAGAVFGLVAFILSAIILVILKIVKVPSGIAAGISNLLSYGGIAGLGYELVYLEDRSSVMASAVVYYIGKPLFYSGMIAFVLAIIFFIMAFMKKKDISKIGEKIPMAILIIFSSFLFSGCSLLGDMTELSCGFIGDGKTAAHCYQEAAVQKNDEKICDKAPQGKEFESAKSNPPQDKCYYMVAENKRDPKVCDNIKGGMLSYTASECKTAVLDSAEKEIRDKLEKTNDGKSLSPQELQKIQKQMNDYNDMLQMMSNTTKSLHDMNMGIVKNQRT